MSRTPAPAGVERALLLQLAQGPVSGVALARELGVTRAAVWKRIVALREAGIAIQAQVRAGYSLAQPLDLLDADAIRAALPATLRKDVTELDVLWSVDSTNSELLRRTTPARGCAVLLAERQTGGRGRRGRRWASPLAAHIYLSLARGFRGGLARLAGLSLAAGVAAGEALHAQGFGSVRLKWPNDLVVTQGDVLHKLGGLLVEGGGETAGSCRSVIGLGLNVRMPPELAPTIDQPWIDLAGLAPWPPARGPLAGELLAHLLPALELFEREGLEPFLARYRRLDALAGREVEVREDAQRWSAQALGIAADGALRVRDAGGRERRIHAGDVSVRT